MASLYEQYMTSVAARDQRLEAERQRALEQQALMLREQALAEQIRAAGVSEAQAAEQLGLMRDQFETEKEYQDYLKGLRREATIETKEGERITSMFTPGELINLRAPEQDPYQAYQFRMSRAPIETASVFNRLIGQADFTPEMTEITESSFPAGSGSVPGMFGSLFRPNVSGRQVETVPAQRFAEYGAGISQAIRGLTPTQIEAAYVNPQAFYASLASTLQPVPTDDRYSRERQNLMGMLDRALIDTGLPTLSTFSMSNLTQQSE